MNIQRIDLPSLLKAVSWPAMAAIALAVFRRPLATLISVLGQKVSKFSIGKFSVEMAQVQKMEPSSMDTEIRQLESRIDPAEWQRQPHRAGERIAERRTTRLCSDRLRL